MQHKLETNAAKKTATNCWTNIWHLNLIPNLIHSIDPSLIYIHCYILYIPMVVNFPEI